jgi:hypothetical protein
LGGHDACGARRRRRWLWARIGGRWGGGAADHLGRVWSAIGVRDRAGAAGLGPPRRAGNITAQFPAIQGPTPKAIAVSGGTGNYRNIGGDGTLVEFGNGKGKLTLYVLSNIEEAD